MTKEEFAKVALSMQDTLYRVSYGMVQNPHDQADAVQECILRALTKLPTLRDERFVSTWLVRILINVCKDMIKRRGRECSLSDMPLAAPEGADIEMADALSRLPIKLRQVIILHHMEGYTTREVAAILKIPEGTVKYRLVGGRNQLKTMLEEGGGIHAAT